jgi:hypothetical protein
MSSSGDNVVTTVAMLTSNVNALTDMVMTLCGAIQHSRFKIQRKFGQSMRPAL